MWRVVRQMSTHVLINLFKRLRATALSKCRACVTCKPSLLQHRHHRHHHHTLTFEERFGGYREGGVQDRGQVAVLLWESADQVYQF